MSKQLSERTLTLLSPTAGKTKTIIHFRKTGTMRNIYGRNSIANNSGQRQKSKKIESSKSVHKLKIIPKRRELSSVTLTKGLLMPNLSQLKTMAINFQK